MMHHCNEIWRIILITYNIKNTTWIRHTSFLCPFIVIETYYKWLDVWIQLLTQVFQHDFKIKFDILLRLNENENGIYLLNFSLTIIRYAIKHPMTRRLFNFET
jgi:hypothetical protein